MKAYFFFVSFLICIFFSSCNDKSSQTMQYDRKTFKIDYPGNWEIDSTDKDFNTDNHVMLSLPDEDGFVSLFTYDTYVPPQDLVNAQVEAFSSELMKEYKATPFNMLGKYEGEGVLMEGSIMGLVNGKVKIFAYASDSSSYMYLAQVTDDFAENNSEKLTEVENSIVLK